MRETSWEEPEVWSPRNPRAARGQSGSPGPSPSGVGLSRAGFARNYPRPLWCLMQSRMENRALTLVLKVWFTEQQRLPQGR